MGNTEDGNDLLSEIEDILDALAEDTDGGDEDGAVHTKITFQKGVNSQVVSPYALDVIDSIGQAAGLDHLEISSTYRNPQKQMSAMYNNLFDSNGDLSESKVAQQKKLYSSKGDAVIDAAIEASQLDDATPESIKQAMLDAANIVGFVSKHSSDNYASYNTIDISYKNLSEEDYENLLGAAQSDSRIAIIKAKSDGDPALHLEIPIPALTDPNNTQNTNDNLKFLFTQPPMQQDGTKVVPIITVKKP